MAKNVAPLIGAKVKNEKLDLFGVSNLRFLKCNRTQTVAQKHQHCSHSKT